MVGRSCVRLETRVCVCVGGKKRGLISLWGLEGLLEESTAPLPLVLPVITKLVKGQAGESRDTSTADRTDENHTVRCG